ncbi:MAG: hypothetical protein LUG18_15770 [Candidatus Azobacteroides sp.]|nr:hypothetical protein [Candidatus Azobacteroides sp.]
MNTTDLHDNIVSMISQYKHDEKKLLSIFTILENEFLAGENDSDNQELPEEYKDIAAKIVNAMDRNFISLLNPETLEVELVNNDGLFNPEGFVAEDDDELSDYDLHYRTWSRFVRFDPLSYDETYNLMENFIHSLNDPKLSDRLEDVYNKRISYENFSYFVENSKYRKNWLNFKHDYMETMVKSKLLVELNF